MTTDEVILRWFRVTPNDPCALPPGWEERFGLRGRFLKYDSVEHAERKNMIRIRETGAELPFGYCNQEWQALKANLQPGDEIWRYGCDGGEVVYLIRDGRVMEDSCGKYSYPKRGYHIVLSCF